MDNNSKKIGCILMEMDPFGPRTVIFVGSSKAPDIEETRLIIRNAIKGVGGMVNKSPCPMRKTVGAPWDPVMRPGVDTVLHMGAKYGTDKIVREEAKRAGVESKYCTLSDSHRTDTQFFVMQYNNSNHYAVIPNYVYMFHWDLVNASRTLRYLATYALKHHVPKKYFLIPEPDNYESPTYYTSSPRHHHVTKTCSVPVLPLTNTSSTPPGPYTTREKKSKWYRSSSSKSSMNDSPLMGGRDSPLKKPKGGRRVSFSKHPEIVMAMHAAHYDPVPPCDKCDPSSPPGLACDKEIDMGNGITSVISVCHYCDQPIASPKSRLTKTQSSVTTGLCNMAQLSLECDDDE